jgi:hypothetical protein
MKRVSIRCSLITAFALASFPASLDAQNARLISESQPILQPETLPATGQDSVNRWSMPRIPTDTPSAKRKNWIGVGPGSLPLAVAAQPDVTRKYGTNSGVLQVYFGRRPKTH